MPNVKEIILPEHNSSRLIFVENPSINDGYVNLQIRDTTNDQYCTETSDYQYNNNWLLGKLNNYIWFVEDVGQYDLNHEHTAEIYYNDPDTNNDVVLFNVIRVMEYGEECDRLYTQYSGGLKLLLTDIQNTNTTANMYIKYERNLPGCYEETGIITNDDKEMHYVIFYKYDGNSIGISELMVIANELIVNTDEIGLDGLPIPMNGLNYCYPIINNVNIDFSKLSIDFSLPQNDSNDIKVGILGINSNAKKFISYRIYNNCIEPSYFIVQTPSKRSWICYRSCYNMHYGIYYNNRQMPNNTYVGFLNRAGSSLNGYFGTHDNVNNKYVYEINISNKNEKFHLMIPSMFTDWEAIEWLDQNNNHVSYDGLSPIKFFNDLDGLYYRIYSFPTNSSIYKIIIRYDIA